MKVLIASPEVVPFSKTGGLADVAGVLPYALKEVSNCDVRVISPLYRTVKEKGFRIKKIKDVKCKPFFRNAEPFELFEYKNKGVKFYFIGKDKYFGRAGLYGTPKGEYKDSAERFSFFSRAILAAMIDIGFYPDIIHACDWETALLPFYRKINLDKQHHFKKCKFLFTIHNLAYQGRFKPAIAKRIDIRKEFLKTLKSGDKINFMKAGILYSDAISTVSKKYAREILTKEYGCGLDGILKRRKKDLHGILNGVDYSNWNPKTDKLIPVNYNYQTLENKLRCKDELLKRMGMTLPPSSPLLGFVGRLAEQKGIDLMINAIDGMINLGAGFILLGTGVEKYEKALRSLAKKKTGKIGISIAFDNKLAHMIEAGVDIFLMPSRYEPCGLNQMYSLKYGTIPIVRATGGLDDTITDYSEDPDRGNGFKFKKVRVRDFLGAIKRAIDIFNNKEEWLKLQKKAMGYDFSWRRAAGEYIALYKRIIK